MGSGDSAPQDGVPHVVAATTVGAAGGTLMAEGVVLTIPAGALTSDTPISIAVNEATVPQGYAALSPLYSFSPDGTVFLKPVSVTFPLATTGPNPTVFWSNAIGGYDALATTATATTGSASVTHFSRGFVGVAQQSGVDAGPGDDSGATDGAAKDGAPVDAGVSDANDGGGAGVITAKVDNVATTFAVNASATVANGITIVQADDNATPTHWQLQLMMTAVMQQACSASQFPAVTYTHFTSGVADLVFSSHQIQGYCTITFSGTPTLPGQHVIGSFISGVDRAVDAGGGIHLLTNGTFDVTF